jgi:hypothetical protein
MARAPEARRRRDPRRPSARGCCGGSSHAAAPPSSSRCGHVADGGGFDGSVEEKRASSRRAFGGGFIWTWRWTGPRASRGRAAADRVILSLHGGPCEPGPLARATNGSARRARVLEARAGGEAGGGVRGAPRPAARGGRTPRGVRRRDAPGPRRGIFAPSWGSWGSYGAVARGRETLPGSCTTRELLGRSRRRAIGRATRRFALVGTPVLESRRRRCTRRVRGARPRRRLRPVECDDLDDARPSRGTARRDDTAEGGGARALRASSADARWGASTPCARGGTGGRAQHRRRRRAALLRPLAIGAGDARSRSSVPGTARGRSAGCSPDRGARSLFARERGAGGAAASRSAPRAPCSLISPRRIVGSPRPGDPARAARGSASFRGERARGTGVLDLAYGPRPTPLVTDARAPGLVGHRRPHVPPRAALPHSRS